MPISLNVNIDKIDKGKFFTGKKGRYIDLVLWETPDSEYGEYMVKQKGGKGERMPILGNAKHFEFTKKESHEQTDAGIPVKRSDPW